VWLSKQKIFFVTIFILFSLPFTTAFTTNLLDERHSIINNYVIVETDNPDFEISLYGLDNDRVVNQKIYELQSEIVYYDVASEKEIVCKTIIEDLNGDIHKCYETIYTEESKTIESWVELSKPTKEIEYVSYAERDIRILEDSKLSSLKTVISVDSIKLNDSKLITYKVTWETPIGKEEWYLKLSEESDGYYLQAVDYFGHQIAGGALLHIRKNGQSEKSGACRRNSA